MKKSRVQPIGLMPPRHWIYRAGLGLLVTLSLSMIIMSKTGNPAIERLRTSLTDAITPVLSLASRPLDAIASAKDWVHDIAQLRSENVVLKEQNRQLLQWQAAAKGMEEENKSLRRLVNMVPVAHHSFITARVVSDLGGPYVHSALIDGGGKQGVKKYQAVVNENGLVGRIVEVGESSARVLLLSDINSRVPVMAEALQEKAILAGNNNGLPSLSYLPVDSKLQVGDRIVTSGDGGVFPRGLPVGIVTSIEKGKVLVQPFVDPARADYVSVVDYAL